MYVLREQGGPDPLDTPLTESKMDRVPTLLGPSAKKASRQYLIKAINMHASIE
jgi:hypothetical protein